MPSFVWIQNVVFPLLYMGMGTLAMYGVYRTVNRLLDRRHEARLAAGGDGRLAEELDRLRQRVEALEDQTFRMQELEERVDFAERMLAQQSDRPVLRGDN